MHKFISLRVAAVILALFTWVSTAAAEPKQQSATVPAAVISEIQVKLFYANSGRFSANLAEKKNLVLWNVVIGEGAGVDGPSENTLLLVTVAGPPKQYAEKLRLKVVAKTEKKTILDRDAEVGMFNTNGNWYAPFLLYDTGCEPVTVTAQLVSDQAQTPVSFVIPFACGE